MTMSDPLLVAKNGATALFLLPVMANRHGLITGATGTGKTVTLQTLAEQLSRIGVPVFMADVKGDLSGMAAAGGGELNGVRLLSPKTVEVMTSNNLPPNVPGIGFAPGAASAATGYGLGVSVLMNPALAGNLGSKGTFGWAGAASTWAILDPEEDMVMILMAQYMVSDADFAGRFQTLAYQAIVD